MGSVILEYMFYFVKTEIEPLHLDVNLPRPSSAFSHADGFYFAFPKFM
ncbi:MAG: hypothetical protein MHPDNHAH_00894 [Anaerolineales bacterium]|nr:hypothetical protein [Anaerolineales bacterium]